MTAKKAAKKKATPRKRAAKKTVVTPLPPPAPIQPETNYFDQNYTADKDGAFVRNAPIQPHHQVPAETFTWWQRFLNRIEAILDGRIQGTTDPP